MIHTTREHRIGDNIELMREMPADSIDTIITSPPYWGLRDYGVDGQIGLEPTMKEYHARLLEVTTECMRVLKPTGVMFWNHGDSYGGSASQGFGGKSGTYAEMAPHGRKRPEIIDKCLIMQNERLIIKMIDDQGWILRNRIIWNKPNGMPASVTDRFSNRYEPVYMLVKSKKYWFDLDAVRIPHIKTSEQYETGAKGMRNRTNKNLTDGAHNPRPGGIHTQFINPQNPLGKNPGDVWTIPTQPYKESHFATFPTALIEPMIKAACPEGGTVLDPFAGSGTVGEVARNMNRNAILLELNPEYGELIAKRTMANTPPLTTYFGGECP